MSFHDVAKRILVFHDSAYPEVCSSETLAEILPGIFEIAGANDVADELGRGCALFVSFHGPYFPKQSWNAILSYLQAGGNVAIFGGMPFLHPVSVDGSVEPEQDSYTKQIFLGPIFPVLPAESEIRFVPAESAAFLEDCALSLASTHPGRYWSCYPKLTQVSDHPEDTGSAGPFDTILTPLLFAEDVSTGSRLATPAFLLDQRQGLFRGGRWLISAWKPFAEADWLANKEAIQRMLRLALQGMQYIEGRPTLACYQPGEMPALVLSARTNTGHRAQLLLRAADQEEVLAEFNVAIPASSLLYEQSLRLPPLTGPGLYRLELLYGPEDGSEQLRQVSGFWIWDAALAARTHGKRLTAGRDYFYQGDELFPIFGSTYMDSQVQRRFLALPNPARWSRDFAAMKALGINLLRTGIWTAWREIMPLTGYVTEAALRALDAFVMTACMYDMQIIFTLFTFYPPLFEGINPWLDPRSLQGQQDFVAVFARRYADIEIVSWDLINEPSFGDPAHIFAARPIPHYDAIEVTAFQRWLAERYTLSELLLRWRETPADLPSWERVQPPLQTDYATLVIQNHTHNMLKVADFTRFSQEMFNTWAARMYETIRACKSQTLVGVGQDEAGARISPQYYATSMDYTTTHPWWNNDALLWDMLIDKTPLKPNLIQEMGIMLVRDVDGRPWRSEEENADLLERKFITGLAARCAGLVQWLWHTNPYMTSDNENSIGLVRADGSVKPEMAVMSEFAPLMQLLAEQLVEPESTPAVWLVIPYSQWFVRPELAIEATQRAIRVLGYDLGIIPQMVGEHHLNTLAAFEKPPQTIIVPALQLFDEQAWRQLQHFVYEGGTLLVSGVISRSPHNLAFDPRVPGVDPDQLIPSALSRHEEIELTPGTNCPVIFDGDKIGSVRKAHNQLRKYQYGAGTMVWCGLPLELSSSMQTIHTIYRDVLDRHIKREQVGSPLLVLRQDLKEGSLVLVVSETSSPQRIVLDEGGIVEIAPNRAGAAMMQGQRVVQTFGGLHRV